MGTGGGPMTGKGFYPVWATRTPGMSQRPCFASNSEPAF